MKQYFLFLLLSFTSLVNAQDVSIMSFNIRYNNPSDGENRWDLRKNLVIKNIKDYNADFVGLQEVLNSQYNFVKEKLVEYNSVSRGRGVLPTEDEATPIFYKKKRWQLLNNGYFWLSETPYVPASKSWNTACCRMATWAYFKDKTTNETVVVVNTHLDHVSVQARVNGIKLIAEELKKFGTKTPCILIGDFNAEPNSDVYKTVVDEIKFIDTYRTVNPTRRVEDNTFRGWNSENGKIIIDYIFSTKPKKVKKSIVDRGILIGKYTSDHLPVYSEIEF
jgi:endonuclease/exonuclease/phosphatase family metal-dependent hydrolase